MDDPRTPPLEELLAHTGWARALARRLVLDEQRADDVVQQAWLAALERPPTPGPGLRAWLARVIQRAASNQRRAELRRARHESRAAISPTTAAPSSSTSFAPLSPIDEAASLVDELAAQKLVVDALLRVDEPYRETLLRRWYRDEKPSAIARSMDVPVKTVETRLARGLERLRTELTALRGGDRRAWAIALVPMAVQAKHAAIAMLATTGVTGVVAAIVSGVVAMETAAKVTATVGVAAIAIASWIGIQRADDWKPGVDRSPKNEASTVVEADRGGESTADRTPSVAARVQQSAVRDSSEDRVVDHSPFRGHVHGHVTSNESRSPVANASVTAFPRRSIFVAPLAQTKTDADGSFELALSADGVQLNVSAEGFVGAGREVRVRELEATTGDAVVDFVVERQAYGAVVCRLVPKGSVPVDPVVLRDAHLELRSDPDDSGSAERFADWVRSGRRFDPFENGVVQCDRVPARAKMLATVRLGNHLVGQTSIDALTPNETREVSIPLEAGVVVTPRVVDAVTRQVVQDFRSWDSSDVRLRWTSSIDESTTERWLQVPELKKPFTLPGPGRLELDCRVRGFAPATVVEDVAESRAIDVVLEPLRHVVVKTLAPDGGPILLGRIDEMKRTETTVYAGFPDETQFAAQVAPCNESLPGRAAPIEFDVALSPTAAHELDANRVRRIKDVVQDGVHVFKLVGFDWYGPREPRFVGIYADGALVASTRVDASVDSTNVTLDVPELPRGSLRLRAVDVTDHRPVANFVVQFVRLAGPTLDPVSRFEVEVEDPKHGECVREQLPASTYRMHILGGSGPAEWRLERWSGTVVVAPKVETDLGDIAVASIGGVEVNVVDESGRPVANAGVSATASGDDRPCELQLARSPVARVTTTLGDGVASFDARCGAIRISARADGFEPGFVDRRIESSQLVTCTIVLRRRPSKSPESGTSSDR